MLIVHSKSCAVRHAQAQSSGREKRRIGTRTRSGHGNLRTLLIESCVRELVMSVLADARHRRRLGTFVPGLFGEPHFVTNGEMIREDAVVMEIDPAPLGLEIPPLALDVEISDAAVLRLDAGLDVLALLPDVILELPPRGMKRIPDRHVDILVRAVEGMIVADDDVGARHGERHPHVNALALAMVLVRVFDHHVTALDSIVELLQLGRSVPYEFLECRGRLHISKRDLDREGHGDRHCIERAELDPRIRCA
jgi:hypothetical protein